MKRWAILTVCLYAVSVSVLAVPILFFLGSNDREAFFGSFFLFVLPALVAIQGVLLLVPVAVVRSRPVGRRTALSSAVVGALPLAVLLGCSFWFLFIMLLGEDSALDDPMAWASISIVAATWIIWGWLFYRRFSESRPEALTTAITGWLLKGSILEILVAIPSHIISRQRNECCAPGFTLLGLTTGIAVALMAFGPGLFFLLAARIRQKRGTGG